MARGKSTEVVIAKFGCPQEVAAELLHLCEQRIDLLEAQLGFVRNAQRVWASDANHPALDRAIGHVLELTFDHLSATLDAFDEIAPLAELKDHTDLDHDVVVARLRAAIEAAKQRLADQGVPSEIADASPTVRYGDGETEDSLVSSID